MDDTNALTADEAKYFETGGQAELPIEQPESAEKPSDTNSEVRKDMVEEKANVEEKKTPPEIEIVEDDDGTEPDARKYVKVGVLRKEREAKKALRQQIEQTNQQLAQLRQQIEQAKNPPREIAPEEAGPLALQRLQEREAAEAELYAKQNFITGWNNQARQYMQSNPDAGFDDAYRFALDMRRSFHQIAGMPEERVNQLLEAEEANLVALANQAGVNPAERIIELAKRLGWQGPQKKAEAKSEDKVLEAAEKLAKIQKGMEKNKSVSGGGSSDSTPSLHDLAEMDDAEFDKATSGKNWAKMWG